MSAKVNKLNGLSDIQHRAITFIEHVESMLPFWKLDLLGQTSVKFGSEYTNPHQLDVFENVVREISAIVCFKRAIDVVST